MRKQINRIGEINVNRYGSTMIIEKYNGKSDIIVRFIETNNLVTTHYVSFKNGQVRNPYDRSLYGKGFLGEGVYKASENNIHTPQYRKWKDMLKRVFNEKYQTIQPTYFGTEIVDEWLNFQNFARWYDENFYEIEDEVIHLDKDILVKGNKLYSPETCVFAPKFINNLFTKHNALTRELPIGVYFDKWTGKYKTKCSDGATRSFETPEDAFREYKTYKEKLIKDTANRYKNQIPSKLYKAMMNYIVEITD